ncbi:MAG: EutP/PduV family microcompartment system protein, partial [Eubacterium sp.]
NRPVIGIVTQIDHPNANTEQAIEWLKLTCADPIFPLSSFTGEGMWKLLEYLREPGDVLPWENAEEAEQARDIKSTKYEIQELGQKDFEFI